MLDHTDKEILKLLQENSRLQWREIGEKVHMTGQAAAARIRRMEDLGVIKRYTVELDAEKLGRPLTAFIIVHMKNNDHHLFQDFLRSCKDVTEAHRISGSGCYWVKAEVSGQQELTGLLDEILKYGNYSLSLSVGEIK